MTEKSQAAPAPVAEPAAAAPAQADQSQQSTATQQTAATIIHADNSPTDSPVLKRFAELGYPVDGLDEAKLFSHIEALAAQASKAAELEQKMAELAMASQAATPGDYQQPPNQAVNPVRPTAAEMQLLDADEDTGFFKAKSPEHYRVAERANQWLLRRQQHIEQIAEDPDGFIAQALQKILPQYIEPIQQQFANQQLNAAAAQYASQFPSVTGPEYRQFQSDIERLCYQHAMPPEEAAEIAYLKARSAMSTGSSANPLLSRRAAAIQSAATADQIAAQKSLFATSPANRPVIAPNRQPSLADNANTVFGNKRKEPNFREIFERIRDSGAVG